MISWPWNFNPRTEKHYKADKVVNIAESIRDSDEEFYLVIRRFYSCIAKPNLYGIENGSTIASNLSLKFNKGRDSAPLCMRNPFIQIFFCKLGVSKFKDLSKRFL